MIRNSHNQINIAICRARKVDKMIQIPRVKLAACKMHCTGDSPPLDSIKKFNIRSYLIIVNLIFSLEFRAKALSSRYYVSDELPVDTTNL